ncbi:exodeoxyribonuclease VII large subunit [Corynebacterium pyruviciproducens]
MARQNTSPEHPFSVSTINDLVGDWIGRLGSAWVEGELIQISMKRNWAFSYLYLKDLNDDVSMELTCPTKIAMSADISNGDRVLVHGQPRLYKRNGRYSLMVSEIRHVGIGEELARIEKLRHDLATEGLFNADRKQPLPVLPNCVGLITGRDSAAERDVLKVTHDRWPAVQFRIINTAVQGQRAEPEIIAALKRLDADPEVDVIIIARGGGSVEDLFPFSREQLIRAVAAASTPVISAIGHEPDHPILDNVADFAAKTPTDAGKNVVPDATQEALMIQEMRSRAAAALRGWVKREEEGLHNLRSRPVLSDPYTIVTEQEDHLHDAVQRIRRCATSLLTQEDREIVNLRARVTSLGPAATLRRGYSVVQVVPRDGTETHVVTSIEETPPGSQLRIRVTDGSITAATMSATPAD